MSIVLMTMDQRHKHLDILRSALSVFAFPVLYLVNLPIDAADWLVENLALRSTLLKQNSDLREEQLRLQSRLQKLAALEAENARLRGLLDSTPKLIDDRLLIAELLAVDLDPYRHRIVVDKGQYAGIFADNRSWMPPG